MDQKWMYDLFKRSRNGQVLGQAAEAFGQGGDTGTLGDTKLKFVKLPLKKNSSFSDLSLGDVGEYDGS